jgi:hypothetical protein
MHMEIDTEQVVRLTNGTVDVEVSTGFGPRVLRYGYVGDRNVFARVPHLFTDTALGRWLPIGGHRLWVAPERMPGSYAPDIQPVEHVVDGFLKAECLAPTDPSGMQKSLTVVLDPAGTRVSVTHVVINRTHWPVRVAPWGISVVDPRGAAAIMPQPPHRPHSATFLPVRPLVQWAYTDFTDQRLQVGRRLITLRPDPSKADAQKIGAGNPAGWCGVVYDGFAFVKMAEWIAGAEYPDLGCNTEFFTAGDYLEVETLGPLRLLEPGDSATHVETWLLVSGISNSADEQELENEVVQHVAASP